MSIKLQYGSVCIDKQTRGFGPTIEINIDFIMIEQSSGQYLLILIKVTDFQR